MQYASLSLCLSQMCHRRLERHWHMLRLLRASRRDPPFPLFLLPSPVLLHAIHSPLYPWGEGGDEKKNPSMSNRSEKGRPPQPPPSLGPSSAVPAPVALSLEPRAGWMNPCARRPPRRKPRFGGTNLAVLLGPLKRNPFYSNGTQSAVFSLFRTTRMEGRFGKCHPKQQWRRRGPEEGGEGGAKKSGGEQGQPGGKMGRKEGVICVRTTTTTTRGGRVARTKCCGGEKRKESRGGEEKGNRGGPKGGPRRFF